MCFRLSFHFSLPFAKLSLTLSTLIGLNCLAQPAFCQRDYNPNYNHFYMGRQEWTVEDNSPVIIDKTGTANSGANGSLINRPTPLPKAGWQGYAPIDNPPASNNAKSAGATKSKNSAASKAGQKGHTGNLSSTNSPNAIRGYKPYATYSNPVSAPNAGADLTTTQHVKGSLLHWARRVNKQQ